MCILDDGFADERPHVVPGRVSQYVAPRRAVKQFTARKLKTCLQPLPSFWFDCGLPSDMNNVSTRAGKHTRAHR